MYHFGEVWKSRVAFRLGHFYFMRACNTRGLSFVLMRLNCFASRTTSASSLYLYLFLDSLIHELLKYKHLLVPTRIVFPAHLICAKFKPDDYMVYTEREL